MQINSLKSNVIKSSENKIKITVFCCTIERIKEIRINFNNFISMVRLRIPSGKIYRICASSKWNTNIEQAAKRFKIDDQMLRNQPCYGMLFIILTPVKYK